MDNTPEHSKFNKILADVKIEQTKEENELLKNLSTSVGQWTATRGITHLNIAKGRKESNGKVENSNKTDYELLPHIQNVESNDVISRITDEYTDFLTVLKEGSWDWFLYIKTLIDTKNVLPNPHNCYYYFLERYNTITIDENIVK